MEKEEGVLDPQVGGGPAISLFRQTNARWSVTCGDGTNSFGDFNGDDAIQQAIAFRDTHKFTEPLFIELKEGTFDVNVANGSIDVSHHVTIIGKGIPQTLIRVTDSTSNAILMVDEGDLTLKDLTILRTGPPGGFGVSTNDQQGHLRMERVRVQNCSIRLYNLMGDSGLEPAFIARDSEFIASSAAVACVNIHLNDGDVHASHQFINCVFWSSFDNPVCRVVAFTGSGQPYTRLKELLFDNCRMWLKSTSPSGGNLLGNPGVLELDANGSNSDGGTEGVSLDKVVYRNCDVKANTTNTSLSILMHLTTSSNGVSYDAFTDIMTVSRMEIDGGSWTCPAVTTVFNPFTCMNIGGESFKNPALGGDPGGLYIRNVRMGFDFEFATAISHGSATADVDGECWEGPGDSAPADWDWAAFAVSAGYLVMENIDFTGFSQLSDSGDLAVKVLEDGGQAYLTNLRFSNYRVGGPGVRPYSRLRIRPHDTSRSAVLKDIHFIGEDGTSSRFADSFLMIDPNSYNRTYDKGTNSITVDGLRIEGFLNSGAQVNDYAIYLWGTVNVGSLYASSPQDYRNVTIQNCVVDSVGHFLFYQINSIENYISNLKILGNTISNMKYEGIWLYLSGVQKNNFDTINISNNFITGCGDSGIYLRMDRWRDILVPPFAPGSFMIITDNHVFGNGFPDMHLGYLGNNPATSEEPGGVIQGNNCNVQSGSGYIQIGRCQAGALAALALTGTLGAQRVRGVNTGYNVAFLGEITSFYHRNNNRMVHNEAYLSTP
jgi:hypothetical protein